MARLFGALGALALAVTVGFVTPPAAVDAAVPTAASAQAGVDVQQAVQQAFGEVLPDQRMHFAMDAAQASPVDGGGQRFEGSGIATFNEGEAQFVAFTLTLSSRGELVEFDYSAASTVEDADQMAAY